MEPQHMKQIVPLLLLLAAAFAAPVRAQSTLRGTIPFPFEVAGGVLPAGQYEVIRLEGTLVHVYNRVLATGSLVSASRWTQFDRKAGKCSLVFNRYGDRTFLREIQYPEFRSVIPASPQERELVTSRITAQVKPVRVEIPMAGE
jgi:hypothetical protein